MTLLFYVGPLTNLILWLAGFWLEIGLWCVLSIILYSWLYQYHFTRWFIAYPGVLLIWNIVAWIILGFLWFAGSIFGIFYESFISDSSGSGTDYVGFAGTMFTISTITVTFFALRYIYIEETAFWRDNNEKSQIG